MSGERVTAKAPWKACLGEIPFTIEYPDGSMADAVFEAAKQYPDDPAVFFMGRTYTYGRIAQMIEKCAAGLSKIGIGENDRVTVALPNCPQAVAAIYAINLVGAVANMIHPLSAEKEITFYLNESKSKALITLDSFFAKFDCARKNTAAVKMIVTSAADELPLFTKAGYMLTEGRKISKIRTDSSVITWKEMMKCGGDGHVYVKRSSDDPAVILYSGGTTGMTKGIILTNGNFNALGKQIYATNPMYVHGDKMLAAMPVFHGFGLGVCIHSMLENGASCVLVPRFTAKSYAKLITKHKCAFIAGVPTLYEALLRLPEMEKADLSCLKGVYSGGDSLSVELRKKLDVFLSAHGSPVGIREGYGATETVTACCLTPPSGTKEGSIGIPFPDTYMKIVRPGTEEELPYGEEGEILVAGPTVMKEYMNHPEETEKVLKKHSDGLTWVYTGDLGTMDSDGYVYFRGRAKRLIVTSGYNVYPAQLENILDAHEKIMMSCVIGVRDDYRMQKVKAFIQLKPGVPATQETKDEILAYCRKNIAKYAMPREIEFRDELPKTLIGKVAYKVLEEESE